MLDQGFIFHLVNEQGLWSRYKLHTSAEDLTKNRASRKDVIKFALIQQAAQCTLGYLTADKAEQFVSPQYGIAVWAQRLRYLQIYSFRCMQLAVFPLPRWLTFDVQSSGPISSTTLLGAQISRSLGNFSRGSSNDTTAPTPFTSSELLLARTLYWVLVPLFQYFATMVLADTFQYFTHRAFHVNKWLYSETAPIFPMCLQFYKLITSNRTYTLYAPRHLRAVCLRSFL